jgi:polar amino acid transport system substrate-binding protein
MVLAMPILGYPWFVGTLFAVALSTSVYAACSQPVIVPAAPAGKFVIADEKTQTVAGVYPHLLRASAKEYGCQFEFVIVPRVRMAHMFQTGEAHLMIPESQTPEKDRLGEFVPLFYSTPLIISARPELNIQSIDDVLKYPQLRVNIVRSYDWGQAYRTTVERLRKAGMVEDVVDAAVIAKKMQAQRADITIMSAHILYGNVQTLGLHETLGKRLRYIRSDDFEPIPSGVYLVNSLPAADRAQLKIMLKKWLGSQALWREFQATLPPDGLMSLTPLQAQHRP